MFKLGKKLAALFNEDSVMAQVLEQPTRAVSVEEIHAEVDSLEAQSIKAVEELLQGINIPTENHVTKKADLMKSLGFNSSNETIKQSDKITESIKEATHLKRLNEEKLKLVNQYRLAYPTDKIIPMSEFKKVMEKYNLIYAPASAYIKDVPEKNLLEIKNAKDTAFDHQATGFSVLKEFGASLSGNVKMTREDFNKKCSKIDFSDIILPFVLRYGDKSQKTYVPDDYTYKIIDDITEKCSQFTGIPTHNIHIYSNDISMCKVMRNHLFISAPKTHFDLNGLSSADGKEFYTKQQVKVTSIKDPIAFYILKGPESNLSDEFVRIVSKWGTADDQSYLDPIVQDQRMN